MLQLSGKFFMQGDHDTEDMELFCRRLCFPFTR